MHTASFRLFFDFNRVFEIDDLWTNTLGGYLAWVLYKLLHKKDKELKWVSLEVKNLSHGFGDRAIFEDVSFRLLKGEHIGLVGANGEGKSTFMSIVTGKMLPDEGKVEVV